MHAVQNGFSRYLGVPGREGDTELNNRIFTVASLSVVIIASGCRLKLHKEIWHDAAMNGDRVAISKLLDGGLSINATDEAGDSMLTYILSYRHLDVAEYLIRKGADPFQKIGSGSSPIEKAQEHNPDLDLKKWVNKIQEHSK